MNLSPDTIVYGHVGPVPITATLVFSWVVIALLAGVSFVVTRRIEPGGRMAPGQNALEALVVFVLDQIRDVTQQNPEPYLPFVGTLFLFIVTSNVLGVVPGFESPTGSLTTSAALAICVFLAVPAFGIARQGLLGYLRGYVQPTPFMLPFTILGELSRTLALAVRLFGNVMSGTVIVAILLSVAPLFFPVVMQAFNLLIGVIQAYIFAILAIVYIASGTARQPRNDAQNHALNDEGGSE
ncbi:MAG: F0F1 ATP synthase subunit A [Trueperaceae bacterium]|nr:F0F1 ATP synthase subunit A [Trueperaceae bacterium]